MTGISSNGEGIKSRLFFFESAVCIFSNESIIFLKFRVFSGETIDIQVLEKYCVILRIYVKIDFATGIAKKSKFFSINLN
jgi:hypothetical protein